MVELIFHGELDDGGTYIAISVGLSLAIIPIVMLWTSLINLRWSQEMLYLVCALMGVLYLWRLWRHGAFRRKSIQIQPVSLALFLIFLFSFFIRVAMVRDLAAPAWVDSVHHGTLTRLILEQGGVPSSYEPYIDIQHANYHFGFHSGLAAFQWLTGLQIHTGMQIYAQVLNALCIFSAYLLAFTFTKDRLAGIIAALMTGIFSPMPAYYASWGRYTQLAGLMILPVAVALVLQVWPEISIRKDPIQDAPKRPWPWVLAAGIAFAGLLLVHYRVSAFLGVLLFAHWLTYNTHALWNRSVPNTLITSTKWLIIMAAIGVLLSLPWWPETISQFILPYSSQFRAVSTPPPFFAGFAWNLLTAAYGRQVLILAGMGLLLAILLRRWFWPTMVLWVTGMFLLSNMSALGLFKLNFINNISVEISLFLPLTLFGGFLVAWVLEGISSRISFPYHHTYWALAAFCGGIIAFYGARALLPIINPVTLLFRLPDEPAILWLEENIPEEETILINPFLWGYGLYAGQDGGSWIPPLAGRATFPPPVLYGMANEPAQSRAIGDVTSQALELSRDPQALHELLLEQDIHYVFLGARGGAFSPKLLQDSPLFQLLYSKDGAWIFKLQ